MPAALADAGRGGFPVTPNQDARMLAYRIPKFDEAHTRGELNTLAKKGKSWPWVRVPTSMSSDGIRMLLSTPGGVSAFGVYILLVEIAANTPLRGVLANENGAMDARRLAVRTGAPALEIESGIAILSDPDIGWLDQIQVEIDGAEVRVSDQDNQQSRRDQNASGLPIKTQSRRDQDDPEIKPDLIVPDIETDQTKLDLIKTHQVLDEDEDEEVEEEKDEEVDQAGGSGYVPRSRSGGRQAWLVQCSRLSGGSGSSQWRSDKTSAERLYDDLVWPHGVGADEGQTRLRVALDSAHKAATIKPKPMAWLTTTIGAQFSGGAA